MNDSFSYSYQSPSIHPPSIHPPSIHPPSSFHSPSFLSTSCSASRSGNGGRFHTIRHSTVCSSLSLHRSLLHATRQMRASHQLINKLAHACFAFVRQRKHFTDRSLTAVTRKHMVKLIEPTTPPLHSCFTRPIAPSLRSLHICSSHRPFQANLSSPHLTWAGRSMAQQPSNTQTTTCPPSRDVAAS
jgi:hypothetical protein